MTAFEFGLRFFAGAAAALVEASFKALRRLLNEHKAMRADVHDVFEDGDHD